jgi:polar amino acid transport system permease protein
MLKDSALVSFLGTVASQMEIFRRAQLSGRRDFRIFEALFLAAMVYWLLTTIFTFFQARLERKLSKGYVREQRFIPAAGKGAGGGGDGYIAG